MRRIFMLLMVAAAVGAMVVLTAPGAVAQPQPLVQFCEAQDPPGIVTTGDGQPTCTFTKFNAVAPAQHGFTLTNASQVFTITIGQLTSGQDPTPGALTFESCQNPGGRVVPSDNPNCTAVL